MYINLSGYTKSLLIVFGIGLSILLVLVILISLLSFKNNKLKTFFQTTKKPIKKIIVNICFGFIFGCLCGLLSFIDYWQQMPIFTFINFSLLAVFAYQYSLFYFLGAIVPESIIISFLFSYLMIDKPFVQFEVINVTYIIFSYLVLVIVGVIIKIFGSKNKSWLTFFASFVGFTILFFIVWLIKYINEKVDALSYIAFIGIDILFSWMSFLFYMITIKLVLGFLKSYRDILQASNFAEPGVYNQKYGIKQINKMILTKQINFGYVITIRFLNKNHIIQKFGLSAYYTIKQRWNKFLMLHLPFENYVQFMDKNHNYCLFLGFRKTNLISLKKMYALNYQTHCEDKDLNLFVDYLSQMPQSVQYNNNNVELDYKAFLSLYNVHSCNINQLLKYNYFSSITTKKNQHRVYLFKPSNYFDPYATYRDALKLQVVCGDSQFEIRQKNYNIGQYNYFFSDLVNLNLFLFSKKDVYNFAKQNKIYSLLLRYLAHKQLIAFQQKQIEHSTNNRIVIDYDWEALNNYRFEIRSYLIKIHRFHLNPSQIVLNFDMNDFNIHNFNLEFIIKSLVILKNNHINIAFSNLNEENLWIIEKFQPNLAIFYSVYQADKVEWKAYFNQLFTFLKSKKIDLIY